MPVDQRLAGMLAFQVGILCVIDTHMGHIRYFSTVQVSHGLPPGFSGIGTDHGDLILTLIDLFAGKRTVRVNAFLHIGNAGINRRNHGFPLLRKSITVVAEVICQCEHRIIGGAEDLPVRTNVIADQPDDNLCRSVAVCSVVIDGRVNKVQNIMRDIVKAVDQELGVPNQPAFANMVNS